MSLLYGGSYQELFYNMKIPNALRRWWVQIKIQYYLFMDYYFG